ncbi:dTDP-4-dehydrorhamnose 3,5-epimerase [Pontiella sulfatireligans]|uniref:dTDP-4-dehydrorhamnose 3,5-epimerase n=1 Tax=Pontiella sulfatireligans TaxID=2750658 RepID=A0A6C2UQU7_9BACT|nr:dTDP-4-dehydrorhamnose 3,5-epimerase [Pontiella sulfatireligans]VGO21657.1 dTDP-4-dehydrorhamnose 3,5-epimerase [Pontiella sulfatireligans]
MKFEPTPLKDAWVISLNRLGDDRGYFARAFCRKEFEDHGIDPTIAQCNTSFNKDAGTMRGMHYQVDPAAESKMVRCVRGALYDVIIDMRPKSPTYLKHFGIELTAENQQMLYVPGNFAHGFLTMEPDTQAFYMVGEFYTPTCERGLRHDDPAFGIEWPAPIEVISDKDKNWPLLDGGAK